MKTLDLGGEWLLTWSDGQRGLVRSPFGDDADLGGALTAQVPGEVHLDLVRAGLIEDPYTGDGCLKARWVEEQLWFYRREFDAPASSARAWLVFEQLDYAARVYLNGELIGTHHNVFRPCRIDVSGQLRVGRNLLVVELESGLLDVADKPSLEYGGYRDVPLHKRHWLRKPQFQFLWDWCTRLINVGITGPVRLEWTDDAVRLDSLAVLVDTAPDLQSARVTVRAFLEGLGDAPVACRLEGRIDGGVEGGVSADADISVAPGAACHEIVLHVDKPEVWWPIGLGPQKLHTLHVTVAEGAHKVAQATSRIGFRHARFDQSPNAAGGSDFALVVNGRRVFCKGGNFVPADMIPQSVDRRRCEQLVDLAIEANFNFLRVWGGGLYESDDFYDICDERGILVWQDFVFACSRYPTTDPSFHEEIKLEALHQVRRLAHRPSLVAWCGNNENEWGAWDWGYDRGIVLPDHAWFHLTLPRLLATEDPTRHYQPSSPWSPDGTHPNRDDVGDQHPWSVGFANSDFREYRKMACRFPNEGGILGPTSLPTMRACLRGGPEEAGSFAWRLHDNTNGPFADALLDRLLGLDTYSMSVEEYTYWGGLLQGEGLREYCENFRRRMFDSASAAFWMYNDCWPATRSWTIVDHAMRRTPSFAAVRRALAPVALVLAEDLGVVTVFGINDTDEPVYAQLRYGVMQLSGGYPVDHTTDAVLDPNASTPLARLPRAAWADEHSSAPFALLTDDGDALLARARLFGPLFKDIRWPESRLKVDVSGGVASFESETFCWGVCLDLDGAEPLDDNFFDVWPGIPHRIRWTRPDPPRVLHVGNLLAGRVR